MTVQKVPCALLPQGKAVRVLQKVSKIEFYTNFSVFLQNRAKKCLFRVVVLKEYNYFLANELLAKNV